MIWNLGKAKPLDVDLGKFAEHHGKQALVSAVTHLVETQEFLRKIRDLNGKEALPLKKVKIVDSFILKFRDFLEKLNVYDPNDPEGTLGSSPPHFSESVNIFHAQVYNELHSDLAYLTSLQIKDAKTYESFINDIQTEADDIKAQLRKIESEMRQSLNKTKHQAEKMLEKQGDQEVAKIVGVETTQEWAEEYLQYISEDRLIALKIGNAKAAYRRVLKQRDESKKFVKPFARLKYAIYIRWLRKIQGAAFYTGSSYNNIVQKWRFWRGIYFIGLLGVALFYLIFILNNGLPGENDWLEFLIEKLAFLPLIVVLSLGFSFTSKNFRINSNLLEEYKHRYVVAKTLQNLSLLPEIKNQPTLGMELLKKGTDILFEHKKSGYMETNNSEEYLVKQLTNIILDSKNRSGK